MTMTELKAAQKMEDKKMKIKILAEKGKIGYTYPGQTRPQGVFAELDPRAKTVTVRTNPVIGNAVPEAVHSGRIMRYAIPMGLTKLAALHWCRTHLADFEVIAAGYSEGWNGNNHVGRLTEAAQSASDRLDYEAYEG